MRSMVLLEKSSGIQDPNAGSKYGRRPLHLAAVLGDPKPLMRLLAFRADPAAVDEARGGVGSVKIKTKIKKAFLKIK